MRRARRGVLAFAVGTVLLASTAACGDRGGATPATHPTAAGAVCTQPDGSLLRTVVDLDGDGKPDQLTYYPAKGSCHAYLAAAIGDAQLTATIGGPLADSAVRSRDLTVINLPGHTGNVLLLRQAHPRGGFAATLFGFAQGSFAALTADGRPLFDFVATDVMTAPYSAHCTSGGFDVLRGSRVGQRWTVTRTSYRVSGNTVTADASTQIASGLSDLDLQRRYADVASYDLFTGCSVH